MFGDETGSGVAVEHHRRRGEWRGDEPAPCGGARRAEETVVAVVHQHRHDDLVDGLERHRVDGVALDRPGCRAGGVLVVAVVVAHAPWLPHPAEGAGRAGGNLRMKVLCRDVLVASERSW